MNYKISFSEMDQLARTAMLKKHRYSLEDMRKQVEQLKKSSISKTKKQHS